MGLFDEPPKRGKKQGSKKTGGRVKGSPHTKGPTCGAKTKQGHPCKNPAGWKTKHPGEGRCKFHGGIFKLTTGASTQLKDPKNIARVGVDNLRHLAMVVANTENGAKLVKEDIDAEIRTLRTLKAAHEIELFYELGPDGKLLPRTEEEILKMVRAGNTAMTNVVEIANRIGGLLAKKARIKFQESAFTAEDVTKLFMKIGRIIQKYVRDPGDQEALWEEIEAVAVDTGQKFDPGNEK